MRAYSMNLLQRLVSAYECGGGAFDELADAFEVGRRAVARCISRARAGDRLRLKPHGGGYPASLNCTALALSGEAVASRPDLALSEPSAYLRSSAGVSTHPSTGGAVGLACAFLVMARAM